jgi:hypothetical protein
LEELKMPLPSLLYPIICQIQPLDRTDTVYDEELREAVQSETYSSTINIPCQVMWINSSKMEQSDYGVTEESDGYLLLRYVDMNFRGFSIKREDRIIRIGFQPYDLYVVSLQPCAHYPDLNGPGMVKAFFRDKQKSRNQPGV